MTVWFLRPPIIIIYIGTAKQACVPGVLVLHKGGTHKGGGTTAMRAKGGRYRLRYSRVGASPRAIAMDDAAIFLLKAGSIAAREGARPAVMGEGSHEYAFCCPLFLLGATTSTVPGAEYRKRRRVLNPKSQGSCLRQSKLYLQLLCTPGKKKKEPGGSAVSHPRHPRSATATAKPTRLPASAGHHHATKNKGCYSWLYVVPLALERRR